MSSETAEMPEDHPDQDWDTIEWHVGCDTGSLAADGARRAE